MTIWNPEISPAVEAHLTARLPGWRNLIRIGRCGAWSVPVSCEVCGKIVYLCGVEGAEREGSLRTGGGESGAPSSLSPRTVILYAGGGST